MTGPPALAGRWRLRALVAALAGVMTWAWVTDRAGPAEPRGQFWTVVPQGFILAGLAVGVVAIWRSARSGPR